MREYRVLLVAMSGVRCYDAELMAYGLTLPGFVERSQVIASLPSLGLLTLAAHCPPHWHVEYREIDEIPGNAAESLAAEGFDIIALSSFTARIMDAYDLADDLRRRGQTVVLGGLHVSAMPNEAAQHADAIIVGEGERAWPVLLSDFEQGTMCPVYRGAEYPSHDTLTASRTPRYDLLNVEKYNRLTLQTTRGCPLHCRFCAASRTISTYKIKPLDQVRRDLEAILEIWPHPFIELADDNTFVDKKWSLALAKLFAEYRIRWFTETDVSVADDSELLDALAESGCAQILIGFESSRAAVVEGIDRRNWKRSRFDGYLRDIARIQSHGITVNGCFTVGNDGDDAQVFDETCDFVEASGLAEVQVTLLTPFPGTDLYADLKQKNRILPNATWRHFTLFDVVHRPAQMSPEELRAGFVGMGRRIYSDEAVARRKGIAKDCARARVSRKRMNANA